MSEFALEQAHWAEDGRGAVLYDGESPIPRGKVYQEFGVWYGMNFQPFYRDQGNWTFPKVHPTKDEAMAMVLIEWRFK